MNYPPLIVYDSLTGDNTEWQVTPAFSTPISLAKIEDNVCEKLKQICDKSEWEDDPIEYGKKGGISKNLYILNQDEKLVDYFKAKCLSLFRGVLGYNIEDVQITTSWFTKTEENGSCIEHSHCNSWYSGVVYFGDYDSNSSKLQFATNPTAISPMKVFQYNFLNSKTWNVYPAKGMMVLFPSQTRHKVVESLNDITRYSMAFNVMPKGNIGEKDSSFVY